MNEIPIELLKYQDETIIIDKEIQIANHIQMKMNVKQGIPLIKEWIERKQEEYHQTGGLININENPVKVVKVAVNVKVQFPNFLREITHFKANFIDKKCYSSVE